MSSRDYEASHPWITFRLPASLRELPEFWMLLGECQSKCDHLAGTLLHPAFAKELQKLHLARGAVASTAIEGNPLTEEQALAAMDNQLHLPQSQAYLEHEVMNIVDACNSIVQDLENGTRPPVSRIRICDLNRLVLKGTPPKENVVPGEISQLGVVVEHVGYRGAPRAECEYLLDQLCEFLNSPAFEMPEQATVARAIFRAIVAHLYLAWIHPFGDGNGRTARLLEVQILLASGVPAPAAHLLSNHYYQTRDSYLRALDHASKSGGDIRDFLLYALRGFVEGLAGQISELREYQREIIWRDYVNQQFDRLEGKPAHRQRSLLLALSVLPGPFAPAKLRAQFPTIASLYVQREQKTLSRDINTLRAGGFLLTDADGQIFVNKEILKAFAVRRYPAKPKAPAVA